MRGKITIYDINTEKIFGENIEEIIKIKQGTGIKRIKFKNGFKNFLDLINKPESKPNIIPKIIEIIIATIVLKNVKPKAS